MSKGHKVHITLPAKLFEKIKYEAEIENNKPSTVIRRILSKYYSEG